MPLVKYLLVILVILTFITPDPVYGQKSTVLPELESPGSISVDDSFIYVVEEHRIYVYSRDDLKLVKKLGRTGDGPGEFFPETRGRKRITLDVSSDSILVTSNQRLSIFDKSFHHLADIEVYEQTFDYKKAGDKLVCSNFVWDDNAPTTKEFVLTCTKDLEILTNLYETAPGGGRIFGFYVGRKNNYPLIRDHFSYQIGEGVIVIGDTRKGFFFSVYDPDGNHLYDIEHEYDKIPVPDIVKNDRLTAFNKNERYQKYIESLAPEFPDNAPAYQYFKVSHPYIYAFTFQVTDTLRQLIKMEFTGEIRDTLYMPYAHYSTIMGKDAYYLEENDSEEWELVNIKLNNIVE